MRANPWYFGSALSLLLVGGWPTSAVGALQDEEESSAEEVGARQRNRLSG
jgi:hypothetical protein